MRTSDESLSESFSQDETFLSASDRELLRRFVTLRDEDAFRSLVARHSGLIWSVCQRTLACHQDREDVFQATFLKLVMQTHQDDWQESIGGWLYKVAYRLSLNVRAAQKRRRAYAISVTEEPYVDDGNSLAAIQRQDAELALHTALLQLPRRDREAIVLCYLEDRSHEMAAAEIGCSLAALNGRLQRGRRQLLRSLTGRGFSLMFAMAALEKTLQAAPQLLPATLVGQTVMNGTEYLTGNGVETVSPQVRVLCQGETSTMLSTGTILKSAAIAGCAALLWLPAAGLVYGPLGTSTMAYAAPPLKSGLPPGESADKAIVSTESLSLTSGDEECRQSLQWASDDLNRLFADGKNVYEELLSKIEVLKVFNRRPHELKLDRQEFEHNLSKLEETCEAGRKRLETVWGHLESIPPVSDTPQGIQLTGTRTALESVACNIQDLLTANQDLLSMVNNLKDQVPGIEAKAIDWDRFETVFTGRQENLDVSQRVLETLVNNLSELPNASQQEVIERHLRELHRTEQTLSNLYSKLRADQPREQMAVLSDSEAEMVDNALVQAVEKVRGVRVAYTGRSGEIKKFGIPKSYEIAFDALSERLRDQALEKLRELDEVEVTSTEPRKGQYYSYGMRVTLGENKKKP